MKKKTIDLFKGIAKKALRPIPKMTVSQWADSYRMLSSDSSAEPGRWRTDRAPYQRAIMDAFTQYGVWKVVVKSASQIGKSDIMNNIIGRFAHLAPAPIMMIQPTIEMAEDFSKSRIAPMIRDTKVLRDIFKDVKTRASGNTILSKLFPGGRLIMGGANSPAGLASRPIKILLCDEVDRFPPSAGSEGDPIDLASKRMTTFWDKCMGLFSTPTNAGSSRIEVEYLEGTQEEWQHKCPACGEWILISHRDIKTEHDTVKDKRGVKHVHVKNLLWACPKCGKTFTEAQMRRAEQKYIAQNPSAIEKGVRSFFVNCWASPWLSWASVMQEWLEAKGDVEREKVVINTRFGEAYEEDAPVEDLAVYLKRREVYNADLPEGVLLLTAAVDVQDNRLEYEICGWGRGEECWGIKKDFILGVPDTPAVWQELDKVLNREYHFINGAGLLVARTFIDSGGHYTKDVYQYCMSHPQKIAIKGASAYGVPLVYKITKQKVLRGRTIPLVLLGTDSGKAFVMDRLRISEEGAKYMHFPLDKENSMTSEALWARGYDEIYFKGLFSEKKVTRIQRGRVVSRWEVTAKDRRNEPLDLRVYNLACMQSLSPDFEALSGFIHGEKTAKKDSKTLKKEPKKAQIQLKKHIDLG